MGQYRNHLPVHSGDMTMRNISLPHPRIVSHIAGSQASHVRNFLTSPVGFITGLHAGKSIADRPSGPMAQYTASREVACQIVD